MKYPSEPITSTPSYPASRARAAAVAKSAICFSMPSSSSSFGGNGEIGLFTGRRTASATALGAARLRQVRRADLLAMIRPDPDLAIELIELLCARLRVMSERHEDRAFLPLATRLARLVLRLHAKIGQGDGTLPVSQAGLADFTGSTREGVARTLAVWRGRGWIRPGRGTLRLLDRAALEVVAASPDD